MSSRLLVLAVTLVILGCSHEGTSNQRLDVSVKNLTAMKLEKVNIRFGERNAYAGILSPDATKVHMYFEPVTYDAAEVSWIGPSGEKKQETVNLGGVFDRLRPGRLCFEIGATNVIVRFEALN